MALDIEGILDQVVNHAYRSGYFERVNTHEPKNSPGNGLTAAVWMDYLGPTTSGLASTSVLVILKIRIYGNMLQEPQDEIDPDITLAAAGLIESLSGDFELSGAARCVDLLGESGERLSARAGYLNVSGVLYRVMDITLPILVNDVWTQVA